MPSHKNSGHHESPILKKNNAFFDAYFSDVRKEGKVDDVYVGRVLRLLGNGRVEVFYVAKDQIGHTATALIRGLFRGKGKHSVHIDINSVVLMADSGVPGAAQYEIVCLLSLDQLRELRKVVDLDRRLLAFDNMDSRELVNDEVSDMGGFDFIGASEKKQDEEIDVDAI